MLLLQHGNGVTSKDEIVVSEGWTWTSEWIVDANRAVDEDGNNALVSFKTASLEKWQIYTIFNGIIR